MLKKILYTALIPLFLSSNLIASSKIKNSEEYNRNFNSIDNEGFWNCGASDTFVIEGIERVLKTNNLTERLNSNKSFSCFGETLLSDCKASKLIILSHFGRELDMQFKTKKENGKCTLSYRIPLPNDKTFQAYQNKIYNNIYASLSRNDINRLKKEQI